MPYKSQAQAGYFHTHEKELAKQGVDVGEWDAATRGKHLPAHASHGGSIDHALRIAQQVGGVPSSKTRAEYKLAVNPHVEAPTYDSRNQQYLGSQENFDSGIGYGPRYPQNIPNTGPQDQMHLQDIPSEPAGVSTSPEISTARGGTMSGVGRAEHALQLARHMAQGGFDPMGKPGASAMGRMFEGPIRTGGAGRTDVNKHDVASGSYVVPADAVSISGDGNTEAGFKFFKDFFNKPLDLTGGMNLHGGSGMKVTGVHKPGINLAPHQARGQKGRAEGGIDGETGGSVPIIDAGGEIVVPPRLLAAKFGDLDHAHNSMDEIVKLLRSQEVERLKTAPPPKK